MAVISILLFLLSLSTRKFLGKVVCTIGPSFGNRHPGNCSDRTKSHFQYIDVACGLARGLSQNQNVLHENVLSQCGEETYSMQPRRMHETTELI